MYHEGEIGCKSNTLQSNNNSTAYITRLLAVIWSKAFWALRLLQKYGLNLEQSLV